MSKYTIKTKITLLLGIVVFFFCIFNLQLLAEDGGINIDIPLGDGWEGNNGTGTTNIDGSGSTNNNGGTNNNNGGTGNNSGSGPITVPATTGFDTIGTLINNFSPLILPLSGIGFAASIIYSGYVRMFSLGNSEQEKLSINIAKYGAIGFALIFFSSLIVLLIGGIIKLPV